MFFGYPRDNGSAGVRNNVAVISLMDSCNGLARKIVENVRGTVLVTDLFGRKMIGLNHDMRVKAFQGMAMNANLGGIVLVTLHATSARTFAVSPMIHLFTVAPGVGSVPSLPTASFISAKRAAFQSFVPKLR